MDNDDLAAMLAQKGGGSFDIQTYKVGTGGLTRVNIQPAPRCEYEADSSVTGVIADFFGGIMLVGVVTAILALAIMVAVAVINDGKGIPNNGVTGTLIAWCVFSWIGVTLLGGVVFGWSSARSRTHVLEEEARLEAEYKAAREYMDHDEEVLRIRRRNDQIAEFQKELAKAAKWTGEKI